MNEFDETILEIVDRRSGKPGRRVEDEGTMAPFAYFGAVAFVAGLFLGWLLWYA